MVDLSSPRRIHIVGIGGSGMSAIARVLLAMGHSVSGSDAAGSSVLNALAALGANVTAGHRDSVPDGTDFVAVSTAIGSENPEVRAAHGSGLPVLRRAEILVAIAREGGRVVAVAGTHGKTTTSTMVALVLEAGGMDPSWIIGGNIVGKDGGAHWGHGGYFVIEADESDGTFLELSPSAAVVTNVEPDHLEHYGGWPQLQAAFRTFVEGVDGPVVVCGDDPGSAALSRKGVATYGVDLGNTAVVSDVVLDRFSSSFTVAGSWGRQPVIVAAPGLHNVRNAAAALVVGIALGVEPVRAAAGLATYAGVGRRFQPRGEARGVVFVDDYAHLPTEVAAAVAAAEAGGWQRVVTVFQPHRYSRTEQVGDDFGTAFDRATVVVLTDVYAAGEPSRPGVDGTVVQRAVLRDGAVSPEYHADRSTLAARVAAELQPGDLCLTLGAGDITGLADEIQALWK